MKIIVVGVVHSNENYEILNHIDNSKKIINISKSTKFNCNTWNQGDSE